MTPAEAFAALGLAPGASPADVRAAFLVAIKAAHPDAGGLPDAAVRVYAAYAVAARYAREEPCPACAGSGRAVAVGAGDWSRVPLECQACCGSGRRH